MNNLNNLWQSPLWEKFQKKLGRKTWFLKNSKAQLLAIKHNLPFNYAWIDIPRGPIGKPEDYTLLIQDLIKKTKKEKIVFIRIMPSDKFKIQNSKLKICKAHANHQPETTLKLDLTLSEEELLKQMKPKGRYNIRLAKKKSVIVKESQDFSKFYKLIQETTQRNKFGGHSQKYYEIMLNVLKSDAQLLLAEYEGKIIAGGIFTYSDKEGIYYYGASSNQYRNVMAPYLIQWTAIQEAKKRGCEKYDFLGIAPKNADKNHSWKGVTSFKKKFGGEVINYNFAQEIIIKPFIYHSFVFLKKIRKILP